ncbi:MAG: hypothetical protein LBQ66_05110 [Planctomycetaceae bacterium]|nr:hypothetical protein [Planctomycetaceae bacterium]
MAVRLGDPVVGLRRRNRPAVGYPPCVCQHVLAFSSNFFGSITHKGGRDARVPVRAASRRYNEGRGLPPKGAENVTAQRSVTHLTITARRSVAHLAFANTSWRSVQTFLVLLHTEAGGTPAFQSAAASRQLSVTPTGDGLEYQHDSRTNFIGDKPLVANKSRMRL